jgi:hypothetical protein
MVEFGFLFCDDGQRKLGFGQGERARREGVYCHSRNSCSGVLFVPVAGLLGVLCVPFMV